MFFEALGGRASAIAVILCGIGFAQSKIEPSLYLFHVTVRAASEQGVPVADAEVRLDNDTIGITDQAGEYYLARRPLPAGPHTVTVAAPTYLPRSQAIELPRDDQPGLELTIILPFRAMAPARWIAPPPPPGAPAAPTSTRAEAYAHRSIRAGEPPSPQRAPNYDIVRVFYATDRRDTGSAAPPGYRYANERAPSGTLSRGICEVSIPKSHIPGQLESPSWMHFEYRPDPDRHVVVRSVQPLATDAFYTELNVKIASSTGRDALVFIHGYNNTFEQAARLAAQFTWDLQFDGAPILYSWPSKGSLLAYTEDEDTVQWTAFHLRDFLEEVAQRTHAARIQVVAHSMGNRALMSALQVIAARAGGANPRFEELILAAPDIGAETLQMYARDIRTVARRITLYASAHDDALLLSKVIHGAGRAGQTSRFLLVAPGIDTVDASAVRTDFLDHTYFAQSNSILRDIHEILATEASPDLRHLLPAVFENLRYWIMPAVATAGVR